MYGIKLVKFVINRENPRAKRNYPITPAQMIESSGYRKTFDIKTEYSKSSNRSGSGAAAPTVNRKKEEVRRSRSNTYVNHATIINDGISFVEALVIAEVVAEVFSDNSSNDNNSYDSSPSNDNSYDGGSNDSSGG
jgi:hypothetical protein